MKHGTQPHCIQKFKTFTGTIPLFIYQKSLKIIPKVILGLKNSRPKN
jgi:hypothetical protein